LLPMTFAFVLNDMVVVVAVVVAAAAVVVDAA